MAKVTPLAEELIVEAYPLRPYARRWFGILPCKHKSSKCKGYTGTKRSRLGIGLMNAYQTGITPKYQFVAVEFDTYSNQWDLNGIHVGVNVNSMASGILENCWMNIFESKVYSCSIEYNSRNNNLNICFTRYRFNGSSVTQNTQYLSYQIDLRDHLPVSVIVGISAAT